MQSGQNQKHKQNCIAPLNLLLSQLAVAWEVEQLIALSLKSSDEKICPVFTGGKSVGEMKIC